MQSPLNNEQQVTEMARALAKISSMMEEIYTRFKKVEFGESSGLKKNWRVLFIA